MIMAGYEYRGKFPFKHVYFTGIVRDKLRRKMSKSLGNSPDPIMLIEKYGADGVRMGMMLSSSGNDILFDVRRFASKDVTSIIRFGMLSASLQGWETTEIEQPEANRIAVEWFKAKLRAVNAEMNDQFKSLPYF